MQLAEEIAHQQKAVDCDCGDRQLLEWLKELQSIREAVVGPVPFPLLLQLLVEATELLLERSDAKYTGVTRCKEVQFKLAASRGREFLEKLTKRLSSKE